MLLSLSVKSVVLPQQLYECLTPSRARERKMMRSDVDHIIMCQQVNKNIDTGTNMAWQVCLHLSVFGWVLLSLLSLQCPKHMWLLATRDLHFCQFFGWVKYKIFYTISGYKRSCFGEKWRDTQIDGDKYHSNLWPFGFNFIKEGTIWPTYRGMKESFLFF